jgi:hypothetical protein
MSNIFLKEYYNKPKKNNSKVNYLLKKKYILDSSSEIEEKNEKTPNVTSKKDHELEPNTMKTNDIRGNEHNDYPELLDLTILEEYFIISENSFTSEHNSGPDEKVDMNTVELSKNTANVLGAAIKELKINAKINKQKEQLINTDNDNFQKITESKSKFNNNIHDY